MKLKDIKIGDDVYLARDNIFWVRPWKVTKIERVGGRIPAKVTLYREEHGETRTVSVRKILPKNAWTKEWNRRGADSCYAFRQNELMRRKLDLLGVVTTRRDRWRCTSDVEVIGQLEQLKQMIESE